MDEKLDKVRNILKKYNQEHLLIWYNKLIEQKREELCDQILNINFEYMQQLFIFERTNLTKQKKEFKGCEIKPLPYIDKQKISKEEREKLEKIGIEKIKQGKYAVVTMAGGQGTRLGHNGPKGTFELNVGEKTPIFTLLAKTIREAEEKYDATIPWYIMTSRENNRSTVGFFIRHNYFGKGEENVKFFIQNELPMVDTNGKILVDEKGMVKQAADGHGGIFEAMRKNGIIDDMKSRGIEWIFIAGVDNVLAKMVDPLLVGLTISNNHLAAGKSVVKRNPKEKVGIFCRKDNRPSVIEYTEITPDMAEKKNENHIYCVIYLI